MFWDRSSLLYIDVGKYWLYIDIGEYGDVDGSIFIWTQGRVLCWTLYVKLGSQVLVNFN